MVLVSPARRTVETLAALGSFYGDQKPDIRYVNELYEATAETVRDMLYAIDDKTSDIMMLGHNPALGALVFGWGARHCPPALDGAMQRGFPPASIACFTAENHGIPPPTAKSTLTPCLANNVIAAKGCMDCHGGVSFLSSEPRPDDCRALRHAGQYNLGIAINCRMNGRMPGGWRHGPCPTSAGVAPGGEL